MTSLSPSRIERVSGFGLAVDSAGYVFRPATREEVARVFELARHAGRKVVLRGAGRSYGDAALLPEAVVLDFTRLARILDWNPESGVLEAEGGVTIDQVWRRTIEDGWWPPVVSGTAYPTLAGALAMNVHGKNAYRAGVLADYVEEMEVLWPNGESRSIRPNEALFWAVVGSAGLLGAIVRVRLRLKKVESGLVRVVALSVSDWEEHLGVLDRMAKEADYAVGWVDLFARGRGAGRGLIHAAWYAPGGPGATRSLSVADQALPDTFFGFVPKSWMGRLMRPWNCRGGMRFVNAVKYWASRWRANGTTTYESLAAFNFLLDFVPDWRDAYLPGGFIQYQAFVPEPRAEAVFRRLADMQQEARLESFLGVLKRHRPDRALLGYGVDGFSLAMDFKVTRRNRDRLWALCHGMNEVVLDAGGRFYWAKDSTLRPEDVARYIPAERLEEFRRLKRRYDPDGLLSSALAERLRLFEDREPVQS